MQTYPAQIDTERIRNDYAQEYLETVKENRSRYGNFVDNNLTYDPYKEHKSVYNVVYESEAYNPWGKPGGGAPKIDKNGNIKNKIVGTLRWNLNGETEEDRMKRLSQNQKNNNLLLYKKEYASPQNTPRFGKNDVRQATTYNYNFRDPFINSSQTLGKNVLPPISQSFQNLAPNQQAPSNNNNMNKSNSNIPYEMSKIEQEAQLRNIHKSLKTNRHPKQGDNDFNLVSNKLYMDNKPSQYHPNNPYWFARTGPGFTMDKNAPYMSSSAPVNYSMQFHGKKNLDDILENRIPNLQYQSSSNNFGSSSQFVN